MTMNRSSFFSNLAYNYSHTQGYFITDDYGNSIELFAPQLWKIRFIYIDRV